MPKVSFMANGKRVTFTTKSKSRGSKKSKRKSGTKRSQKSKRSHSSKSNKPRRSRSGSHMPRKKRRSGGRRRPGKKSFIDRIPILNNPTVQKVGFGLGMGVIVADLIRLGARFAPPSISQPLMKNERIIKLAVEAATEPISAVVDLILPNIAGQSNGMTQTMNQNMVGFA